MFFIGFNFFRGLMGILLLPLVVGGDFLNPAYFSDAVTTNCCPG